MVFEEGTYLSNDLFDLFKIINEVRQRDWK